VEARSAVAGPSAEIKSVANAAAPAGIVETAFPAPTVKSAAAVKTAAESEEAEAAKTHNGGYTNGESSGAQKLRVEGMTEQQVGEIKAAVQGQQKFLGELLEHVSAWELAGPELKLYFPAEKKSFAEMLEGRESLEKLRSTSSNVLGRPMRVCAKLEAVMNSAATSRAGSDAQELRAKFERDPIVRSILQRFGGKISEVRRPQEE
jgi:hypothetical protein